MSAAVSAKSSGAASLLSPPNYIQILMLVAEIAAVSLFLASGLGSVIINNSDSLIGFIVVNVIIIGAIMIVSQFLVDDIERRTRARVKFADLLRGCSSDSLSQIRQKIVSGVFAQGHYTDEVSGQRMRMSSDDSGRVDWEIDQFVSRLLQFFEKDPLGGLARQALFQSSSKGRAAYFDHALRLIGPP
jgi:hypothetical protein